jgi:predicted ATPase
MNEQLIVKNFGPIKDATVDFKRVTVFIGPTGGGKSTLAKLAAIFRDVNFHSTAKFSHSFFNDYGLLSYFNDEHHLSWGIKENRILIDNKTVFLSDELASISNKIVQDEKEEFIEAFRQDTSKKLSEKTITLENVQDKAFYKELFDSFFQQVILNTTFSKTIANSKPEYVPSERIFIAAINNAWPGLMSENIGLPKMLTTFANQYFQARESINFLRIPFLKIDFFRSNQQDLIVLENQLPLKISETASGIQSVTPLLVLLEHLSRNTEQAQSFIIEEPELNLYPTAQQGLLNWLVEKCTKGENDLTITTHSPYILSSCNLLLEAYKVAQQRPDLEEEIAAIVPKACWLNPDEFAAYYVADGTVKPITDDRTHLIGSNELDAVSGDISDSFRKLLRLKKQAAV